MTHEILKRTRLAKENVTVYQIGDLEKRHKSHHKENCTGGNLLLQFINQIIKGRRKLFNDGDNFHQLPLYWKPDRKGSFNHRSARERLPNPENMLCDQSV